LCSEALSLENHFHLTAKNISVFVFGSRILESYFAGGTPVFFALYLKFIFQFSEISPGVPQNPN
jgi:hypothetical protein